MRRNGGLVAQRSHERFDIVIGKRGMVLDLVHLGFLRQKVVEMASQASWVLAIAITLHLGPVEDTLDAAANSAGGFSLGRPDWLKNLHHKAGVDRGDR